ncbi:MAG: dephospho-CoA kinase [Verrucomicrobiaceae bacterium]|nr:dephospho-CoA kinase [Verrucomicrobiaceae bacterium]
MKCAIISGGIAAGKTTVVRLLSSKLNAGTQWFGADECIRTAYAVPDLRLALIKAFGGLMRPDQRHAIENNESADRLREWLREYVLPSEEQRRCLESILHPYVLKAVEDIRRKREGNLLVAEVPLHYEIGEVISADLVIVVAVSRSVQVRRMMENRGLDEATTQAFLNAQWPIEAKVEKADVVIWNDGDPSALECQTLLLANLLNLE